MINPSISKLVTVTVNEDINWKTDCGKHNATYKGQDLKVHLRDKPFIRAGKRRLYLKFSILSDTYFLSDRA